MSEENTSADDPQAIEFTQEIFQALAGAMDAIVRRNNMFMEATVEMGNRLKVLEEKVEKLLDT
jgi:hypothetical protein